MFESTIESERDTTGIAEAAAMNPFPGLRPFEITENYLFFGRDRQVDALSRKLSDNHFVAVVGTSGSGKSSLVRAGLLPALYGGFMVTAGSTWRVAVMRPGSSPVRNLAEALSGDDVFGAAAESTSQAESIARRTAILESNSLGLVQLVRQAALPEDENLLLVVDQFEELFRFKQNKSIADAANEATAFVKLLLEAVHQRQLSIYVLLTLRSDFLGDCAQFRGLPEAINEGHYLIPRLVREQQREAILGPVAVGGGKISPRLVQQLLNDLGDNPDQLPILQHALMRTWDKWQHDREPGEPIDLRHYEAIGRMRHALSEHADEAYNELPDQRRKRIAEVMFKCLTMRGPDNRGIRRPTKIADICAIAETDVKDVIEVVEYFRRPGRSFIMPPQGVELTPETVLDISHESLMRVWDRLVEWVDQDAQSAQMYLRLVASADLYAKEQAGLWRDPELQEALNWREARKPNPAWSKRYAAAFGPSMQFLDDSVAQREQEQIEKRRRRRLVNAFVVAFLAFAAVLSIWALTERSDATHSAAIAERQQKIAQDQERRAEQSATIAGQQKRAAVAASLDAEAQKRVAEEQRSAALEEKQKAEAARTDAERSSLVANDQRSAAERQSRIADSMRNLAQKSARDVSRLRYLTIAKALAVKAEHLQNSDPELVGLLALQAYRFNNGNGGSAMEPDIFSALHSANKLLNAESLSLRGPHGGNIRSILYRANGEIVSASTDGKIVDWKSNRSLSFSTHAGTRAIALSPDGNTVAAVGNGGKIHLFSYSDGSERVIPIVVPHVVQVAFVSEAAIALLGADGRMVVVDNQTAGTVATLSMPSEIKSFAISRNWIVAGSASGELGYWSRSSLTEPVKILAAAKGSAQVKEAVTALVFSPDGHALATGTEHGAVHLLAVSVGEQRLTVEDAQSASTGDAPIQALAYGPDGTTLATGSSDGKVRIWNPKKLSDVPVTIADNSSWVWSMAFSPDGSQLAVSSADRSVHLIPTRQAFVVEQIQPHIKRNLTREEWTEFVGSDVPYEPTISGRQDTSQQ